MAVPLKEARLPAGSFAGLRFALAALSPAHKPPTQAASPYKSACEERASFLIRSACMNAVKIFESGATPAAQSTVREGQQITHLKQI